MKPIFFTTMGWPGSGKSYFARQLSEQLEAVRLNSDSMRSSMFASPKDSLNPKGYTELFGALDYAASEVVKAGYHVVYDAKCNHRAERKKNAAIAEANGAMHVTVWVKTTQEVALQRAASRDTTLDQQRLTDQQVLVHKNKTLETPDEHERYIVIAGEMPFAEQFKSFSKQLIELSGSKDG